MIYQEKDLLDKNYAILEYDVEEPFSCIASLHKEYDKAKKRLDYLRKQAQRDFENDIRIYDYILVEIKNEKVRKCINYEKGDELI